MMKIHKFCKDAERIFGSTSNIGSLKKMTIKLDPKTDEIYRTRYCQDLSCIFDFPLGTETSLYEEVKLMKTIELFYPKTFSWRFNGKHIEALGMIPMREEHLGKFGRYRGIFNFIIFLRKRLAEILKYREQGVLFSKEIDLKILSTGSINYETKMYVINIRPAYDVYTILRLSTACHVTDVSVRELNMDFWIKEINPDFFRKLRRKKAKRYALTEDIFTKYPPCIKELAKMPKKGNYNRFLLATFLLGVHNERNAKHQLDIMLTDSERNHINFGNCKGQWRAILAKGYSPPNCKVMVEHGHCKKDCGKPMPIMLESVAPATISK